MDRISAALVGLILLAAGGIVAFGLSPTAGHPIGPVAATAVVSPLPTATSTPTVEPTLAPSPTPLPTAAPTAAPVPIAVPAAAPATPRPLGAWLPAGWVLMDAQPLLAPLNAERVKGHAAAMSWDPCLAAGATRVATEWAETNGHIMDLPPDTGDMNNPPPDLQDVSMAALGGNTCGGRLQYVSWSVEVAPSNAKCGASASSNGAAPYCVGPLVEQGTLWAAVWAVNNATNTGYLLRVWG